MISDQQWEEIALQYRREIELLHKDIETAICEFEKRMPRSFEKGIGLLEQALSASQENLYLTKLRECPTIEVRVSKPASVSNVSNVTDGCFEGLL